MAVPVGAHENLKSPLDSKIPGPDDAAANFSSTSGAISDLTAVPVTIGIVQKFGLGPCPPSHSEILLPSGCQATESAGCSCCGGWCEIKSANTSRGALPSTPTR